MKPSASLCITNALVITRDAIVKNSWLLLSHGIIKKIGIGKPPPAGGTINARGRYVSPGCIDLHIHGESQLVSQNVLRGGTTGFVRGLCAAGADKLCAIIDHEKKAPLPGARRLGYYIEGPFLNPGMAGAQPKRALRRPSMKWLEHVLARCGSDIKIMTLAPELRCCNALIGRLRESGIVISLGHSQATYEQAMAAVDAGALLATHMYNRMAAVSSRQPGLVTAALLDERITVEIIADGIHVHPALIKLLMRAKPADRVVLVTDSVANEPHIRHRLAGGVYCLDDGTIAGSCLTMLGAIRNVMRYTDIGLPQAVAMATVNPARVLGIDDKKGKIKAGFDADLVIFDNNFKCRTTIVGGRVVYTK